MFVIAAIVLGITILIQRILYYVAGVMSLLNLIGLNSDYVSFNYILETDKRYVAITSFFTRFLGGEFNFLSAKGTLFFNFHEKIMGVKADNWDDVTILLGSILEFGFIQLVVDGFSSYIYSGRAGLMMQKADSC
jgi:hypothetical protein